MTSSNKASSSTAESGSQDVAGSIGDLGAATAELGHEAQQQVMNLTQQVRQQATDQIASQKERAVDTLEAVALLLHQAGEQAELQEKTMLASYADKAAQQVGTFSETLAQQDVTQIVQTTQNFARREPMLFFGGALAAGFLGARFLRSSAQQVSEDRATQGNGESSSMTQDTTELPAYDIDQTSTASSDGVLGSTPPTPGDAMTPDATGFLAEYEAAVLEDDAFGDDVDTTVLPDIEDIERTENL